MPGLVSECQMEGVAAGAAGGVSHLQQGMKGDPGTTGQWDAGKWMEVGTIKEMSRLKRRSGSQRGVGRRGRLRSKNHHGGSRLGRKSQMWWVGRGGHNLRSH